MKQPWKPSYLRNQGVLTRGQRRILRDHWPTYGLTVTHGVALDLERLFGRSAPTVLDVGFGRGESLVAVAHARPDWNVLGVEVHRPGIAWALRRIADAEMENVRVVRGDVLWLLERFVIEPIIDELRVFFPEPWPRTPERRLIRPETVPMLARACRPRAVWRVATDDADYARHASDVLEASTELERVSTALYAERCPDRPETTYEAKGRAAGRQIVDLHYRLAVESAVSRS